MRPVAPSMSDRDGKNRTFTRVQVRQAAVDVVAATGWKCCGRARPVRHDAPCRLPVYPEALNDGDGKAILLDATGWRSESSSENIGRIEGAADRYTTCPVGKEGRLEVLPKRITRDELYIEDGLGVIGTVAEVTAIRKVQRSQIGAERRAPITEKIQTAYFDIVNGRNSTYAHWLTRV